MLRLLNIQGQLKVEEIIDLTPSYKDWHWTMDR